MKRTVSMTICSLLTLTVCAQDSTRTISKNKYVQFDAGIGYLHTNMGCINNSLKSAGFHAMKEDYTTLSFSSAYFVNRFLFRSEFSLILPNHADQGNNINTEFTGYTISAGIGYALIQRPRFRLYPYVGITSFNTKLKFNDVTPVTTMNEIFTTPRQNAILQFTNAALDLGVQLEKIISLKNNQWDCPQNNKYMTLGIRLGYNLSPGTNKARFNGSQPIDAPAYSFQGPYLKIVIGMGTKIRQLKWR